MSTRISPAVRRRRLALELRRLRDEAGIKAADVAKDLGCSPGKISQLENGHVGVTVPDVKAMLELYGVTAERRDALVELARSAREHGWWEPYADAMHPWRRSYVGLETEASTVLAYRSELVPGLLRTEDYVRAVLAARPEPAPAEQVIALVGLYRERQASLDAGTWRFVLDESVLRRLVGSAEIMRGQLDRLLEAGKRENVTLQVLPFAAGAHPAACGSYTVLEFAQDPAVVYLEHLTGAEYVEDEDAVHRYRAVFEALTTRALSRTRSATLIRDAAREL
jgi:transcriptional regulator with XRE-family HTH domain